MGRVAKALSGVAATVCVLGVLVVAGVADFSGSPSAPEPAQAPTGVEDRGLSLVAGPGGAPLSEDSVEFQRFKAVGFDNAGNGLTAAMALVPFGVELPGYVPSNLRPWNIDLYVDAKSSAGNLEVYWTALPDGGGGPMPGVRVSWSNARKASDVQAELSPPQGGGVFPVVESGTFSAAGVRWHWYLLEWRDFDMYQARAYTAGGILISADVRVVGMVKAVAFEELKKVVQSLNLE